MAFLWNGKNNRIIDGTAEPEWNFQINFRQALIKLTDVFVCFTVFFFFLANDCDCGNETNKISFKHNLIIGLILGVMLVFDVYRFIRCRFSIAVCAFWDTLFIITTPNTVRRLNTASLDRGIR